MLQKSDFKSEGFTEDVCTDLPWLVDNECHLSFMLIPCKFWLSTQSIRTIN